MNTVQISTGNSQQTSKRTRGAARLRNITTGRKPSLFMKTHASLKAPLTGALLTLLPVLAPAATLTWNGGGGSPSDGTDTWASGTSNWWSGFSSLWSNGNDAWFGVGTGGTTAYTVTVSGFAPSVGNLTFSNQAYILTGGTISLGATGTSTITVSASAGTINSILAGTTGFIKSGTGTLILGGVNTYTGATTINQGMVQVSGISNTLGNGNTGAVNLNGGGILLATTATLFPTWAINVGAAGGVLQGNGSGGRWGFNNNTITGSGTLTLNATSAFGRFSMAGSQNGFSGKWVINSNGGSCFVDNAQGSVWGSGTGTDVVTFINGGVILMRGGTVGSATQGFTIGSGGAVLNGANNTTNTIAARLSGTGADQITFGLEASGTTILTNTSNSYSGNTNIQTTVAGTSYLAMGAANVIPGGTGKGNVILANNGGTAALDLAGFNQSINGLSSTYFDSIVDNRAANSTVTLTVGNNDATTTYAGSLRNSGSNAVLNLVKSGTGTLTLSGTVANTYGGTTTINAGMVQFGRQVALYSGSTALWTAANLTVASGATAAFNAGGTGEFTSANLDTLLALGSGSNGFISGASIGIDTSNAGGNFAYASNIANPNGGANTLGLIKLGTGTLTLSGSNSYSGTTTLSSGILNVGGTNALAGGGNIAFGGGTLQYSAGNQIDYSGRIAGNASAIAIDTNSQSVIFNSSLASSNTGGLTKLGSGTLTLSASNSYIGTTAINSGILNVGGSNALAGGGNITFGGGTLQYSAGNQQDYSSRIIGSGSVIAIDTNSQNVVFGSSLASSNTSGLTKSGSGTLTLSSSNSYTGTTTLGSGILNVGGANALAGGGNITFGGGTLQYSAGNQVDYSGRIVGSGSAIAIDTNSQNVVFAASLASSNTGGLSKSGAGTLTLSGSNTYTGTTTILGGAVQVSSITNSLGNGTGGSVVLNGGGITSAIAGGYQPAWAITVGAGGGTLLGTGSSGRWFFTANQFYGSGTLTLKKAGSFGRFDSNSQSQTNFSGKWVMDGVLFDSPQGNTLGTGTGDDFVTLTNGGSVLMRGGTTGSITQGLTIGTGGGVINGAGGLTSVIAGKISSTGTDRVTFGAAVGVVVLSNTANSYSGDTYLASTGNTGYLRLGAAGVIPTGAGKGNLVIVNNGGNAGLDMNGFNQTVNGLSSYNGSTYSNDSIVDNLAANTTATLTVGNNDATSTFTGVIQNTGSNAVLALAKTGAGTLTLSNANTYSGGTTLNGGVLSLGNATALSTGTVTITGNSTLQSAITGTIANPIVINPGVTGTFDSQSNANTLSGAISANGGFTKTGSGSLTLSGSNSFTGTTTINGGTLILGSSNALAGTGNVTFSGGLIQFTAANTADFSSRIKNSTRPIDMFTNGQSITFAGNIDSSNTGGLILPNSSGTLVLAGSNSYFGDTLIINGTLALANPYALAGGGNIVMTGFGALQFSGSNTQDYSGRFKNCIAAINLDTNGQMVTLASAIDSSNTGGLTKLGSGNLTLSSSNAFTGPVGINAGVLSVGNVNALGSGTITFTGNSTLQSTVASGTFANPVVINTGVTGTFNSLSNMNTLSGAISGAGGLTKTGTGTLVLAGNNTYTGATTINQGMVQVSSITNTLGNGTGGSVVLNGGGITSAIAGGYQPAWAITVGAAGGTLLGTGSSGRWFFTANQFYGSGTLTLKGSGSFGRFDSNSQSQTNFSGKWVMDGVYFDSPQGNTLGTGTGDDVVTFTNGGFVLMRGGTFGSVTQGFTIGTGGGAFNSAGGAVNTIAGKISSTGTDRVTFSTNGGAIILSNTANSYAGDTYYTAAGTVSGWGMGYVQLGASGVIPNGPGKGNLVLVNAGGAAGLNLNGFNQTVNGLSNYNGTTYSTDSIVDNLAADTTATLTVGNNDATSTFSGIIENTGSNAVLALVKTGTGTLTLSNANTYSGGTTLNNGVLSLGSASALGTGTVTLTGNSTLQSAIATGTIANPIVINPGVTGTFDNQSNTNTLSGAISGAGGFTKTGTGLLTLSGTGNTFGGGITVQAGGLQISTSGNIGTGAITLSATNASSSIYRSVLNIAGDITGGTLIMDSSINRAAVNSVSGANRVWNGVVTLAGSSGTNGIPQFADSGSGESLTISGTVNGSNGGLGIMFRGTSASDTLSAAVNVGTTPLSKTDGGTWTVTSSGNTWGNTTISNGTLKAGVTNAFPTSTAVTLGNTPGTSMDLGGYDVAIGSLSGGGASGGDLALGANTLTTGGNNTSTSFAGKISGSGGMLVKTGAGTFTLTGSNSYSGGTTVAGGALKVGNASALGTGGLTVNGGSLDFNDNSVSVGALSGTGGSVTNSGGGTSTLTTAVASGTSTYAGNIANGAGAVVLTKTGTGTLVMSGSLTMAGLNANDGVTQLTQSGSIGAVSVAAGATLSMAAHSGSTYNVLDVSSLTLSGSTSTLDLWNNAMIVRAADAGANATNLALVTDRLNAGRDNLAWDGQGINSSTAFNELNNSGVLSLMAYDNSLLVIDTFEGVSGLGYFDGNGDPQGFNQVLLKLTYLGDLSADGVVDGTDYALIDYGFQTQNFGVLATQSGSGAPSTAVPAAASVSVIIASPEAVPEPATLGLLITGALGLLGFRCKRRSDRA